MPSRVGESKQLWHPELARWVPCVVWSIAPDNDGSECLEVLYLSGPTWTPVVAVPATLENEADTSIWKWRELQ